MPYDSGNHPLSLSGYVLLIKLKRENSIILTIFTFEVGNMAIELAEMNTIITMLGMLCATIQASTGIYAAYYRHRMGLIRSNDTLFRAHRGFGGAATTLYFLGLFAGLSGLAGTITQGSPPLEIQDPLYNIHTWGSFIVLVVVITKTYLSYFNKGYLYRKVKGGLGVATFLAWTFTWLTSATAYYVRTVPPNLQHHPPTFLLPIELGGIMLAIPFLIGGFVSLLILRRAHKIELTKEKRLQDKGNE